MNIDNNIGGSPYQGRSQHIEKVQTETANSEVPASVFSGNSISFVNALQSTSLANVLWTVNREAAPETVATPSTISSMATDDADSAWVYQAYTEH